MGNSDKVCVSPDLPTFSLSPLFALIRGGPAHNITISGVQKFFPSPKDDLYSCSAPSRIEALSPTQQLS